ncbi:uncharacterized protein LOC119442223 [Dermacentor silvarum]|uniref:uncharacterized protein LOC119442223 n=1 Tax=Dermacentor silvarum TaxID=543639 RepID=UPI002100D3DD|nr:uncharacterized protein LOC119442223 [Dermacentor silvarum]
MRGLWRLSGLELQQLADSVVSQSPLRQVAWWDLAPLFVPHRLHELLLDRLLIAHGDLRALLGAIEPTVLTRLRVTKIRCTCQVKRNVSSTSGIHLGLGEACATQYSEDVERLAGLLAEAKSLQELATDLPVNVGRLAASGPYEALKRVRLVRVTSSLVNPGGRPTYDRYFLSRREVLSLLQQMPALRELRCDASQAIGSLEDGELALFARLEVVHLLHEAPEANASSEEPFAPCAQFLVAHCPNVREALADACPALESLVARCFLRRSNQPVTRDDRGIRQPPPSPPGAVARTLSSLADIELVTLRDAAALMPLCPELRTITLTLPHMDPADAHELADLCERCPKLERITLNLMGSYPHLTVVHFLQRVARVPQVQVFVVKTPDVYTDLNTAGPANQDL